MARSGLTKPQVRTVRDRLLAEGRYPSVDAVRHALGDVGSKSTIHKYLKELRDEDPNVGIKREDTEDALRGFVEQLAERLHANAEERLRVLRAEHEGALRDKDGELAVLRATVAQLTARLQRLERQELAAMPAIHADDTPDWRAQRQARSGFGRFDSALLSSRSAIAPGEPSPFDLIRTAARS
jgi:hypothetical protein